MSVRWLEEPEKKDYPAAAAYLALVANPDEVESIIQALNDAPVTHQKAKDILRASRLELLNEDNAHVQADLEKIRRGEKLSPILLVRGNLALGFPLQIADGYHRVCASYHTDENTDIPVKIAELPAAVD
jgi:hypothetical protein